MNRRDFLTSVTATVAALVAGLKQARGGHVGGYVTETAAIDTEGFILPPNVSDEPWWGDDFGKLYSETGDLSAVQECECGVTYYVGVGSDACDTNDGLSWNTRIRTLGRAMDLVQSGDKVYVGPGKYRDYVVLD